MSSFPFCAAGLDVGYGNVKLSVRASGESDLRELTMPIGAVPLDQAPKKITGGYDIRDGVIVSIDGQPWAAGMDPSHLQGFARPTHENYPATNEYKALMIGALAKAGVTEVDMLYTGIPVAQYYGHNGVALRTQISNTMTGTHWINSTTSIKVRATTVVPQAAGAYMDILARTPELRPSKGSPTLVVDVGYFSVDWVRVIDNAVMDASSGSSLDATSVLLEKAASLIGQKYGRPISAARLEMAFRASEDVLDWGQVSLHVSEWLELAAEEIAPKVFNEVVKKQRQQVDFPNLIILTGGGGSLYKKAAEQYFPHSKVAVSREPVMANARGFQHLAHHKMVNQLKNQAQANAETTAPEQAAA